MFIPKHTELHTKRNSLFSNRTKGQERLKTNRMTGNPIPKKSVEPTPEFKKKMGIK
jgi:hypothetical protein